MKRLTFLIMLLFPAYMLWAQQTVEGIVTDATTNETLVGVTILIKGSTVGTITDMDGHYSLRSDQLNASSVLVYSYVGYTAIEETIGDRTRIDIKLEPAITQLDELVVIGYGVQKKKDLTGAVSMVDGSKLDKFTVSGIDQALQGRAAGVAVTQNSGAPGDGVSIRIRGTGSIYSSNEPLYVIDGIPTKDPEALNSISTSDIESISILKDAASAAIYGSRANNGVVLVTTKKAKKGESRIDFKSQVGFQTHGYLIPMVNTRQYVDIYNEAANNDNPYLPVFVQMPVISDEYAATLPDVNHLERNFQGCPHAKLQFVRFRRQ